MLPLDWRSASRRASGSTQSHRTLSIIVVSSPLVINTSDAVAVVDIVVVVVVVTIVAIDDDDELAIRAVDRASSDASNPNASPFN